MTRSLPFHSKPKTRQRPEARLQKALVQILRLQCNPGVLWFSTFNERKGVRAMADMKARGLLPGLADMVFVVSGEVMFLELKAENGRLSDSQREFLKAAHAAGARYTVANSFESARQTLEMWGVLRAQKMARAA